jgi:hypothetical protein
MQQTLRGEGDREIFTHKKRGSGNEKCDKWTWNWRGKLWKERKDGKRRIHYGQGKKKGEEYLLKGRKGNMEWKSKSKGISKNGRY